MSFLSSMNISASGLTAQKQRLDIIAENITNINTTRTEGGGPYQRKMVVFQPIDQQDFKSVLSRTARENNQKGGVQITELVEDTREFKSVYDPDHPDANADGYVMMPNVDLIKETVDSMSATRSYDANITAFNAIKMMATKALEIGR
ncbi:flagellar basal body rod protein FlgC [Proteocatella sphenisci]|uniref:flagellar basal body rod protein FlgC n=1 Tax=Proteocatella sphenisci TaxID=181070 RepID=UPI0004915CF8|nr:flagellar basal body rod protein FlgC [Proteocatella sphenisci]